jgi:hypothetical protein
MTAETIGTSWMTSAIGPPEQAIGKSATDNRNITYVNSRRRPATARMPEIVETSQQQY